MELGVKIIIVIAMVRGHRPSYGMVRVWGLDWVINVRVNVRR